MISKHVHYEAAHDNYGALARYIADAGHEGEKCLASWCAGCAADDDYELAIIEAQAVQSMNTCSQKEKTYHLLVSFRPEDEAKLTPEAFKAIEERLAAVLGFSEHQRHCGIHKNTNNIHMHVSYNMIHPERLTRHEPFRDYAARDKLCRELEKGYSLTVDNGREQRRENGLTQKAAATEAHTGQESFESYTKRHKGKILESLGSATHWQDFLKLEAEKGNEVALAVLRSRKEVVEPDKALEPAKVPVKDWSRHGLDYAAKTAIRAEYAEKERELQERSELSASGKKELQAFLRMERTIAEARADGVELGEIKRRIDGKGIVIFTLDSGGTIRDTGKKIFYSVHDTKVEQTARRYAEKK